MATLADLFIFEALDCSMSDMESSLEKTLIFDLGFIIVPGSSLIGIN